MTFGGFLVKCEVLTEVCPGWRDLENESFHDMRVWPAFGQCEAVVVQGVKCPSFGLEFSSAGQGVRQFGVSRTVARKARLAISLSSSAITCQVIAASQAASQATLQPGWLAV